MAPRAPIDPARFERLLAPHHLAARGFARCLCRSRADGDDVFQAALVRALRGLAELRDDAAFRPWLYRIIVTSHRNSLRRPFWRRLVPLGDHDAAIEREPDETLGASQRAARALGALPPVQREAIVLFEIEGFSVDEIAAIQGVSVSAVKSRLARGRERLRAVYARPGGADARALPEPGGA